MSLKSEHNLLSKPAHTHKQRKVSERVNTTEPAKPWPCRKYNKSEGYVVSVRNIIYTSNDNDNDFIKYYSISNWNVEK